MKENFEQILKNPSLIVNLSIKQVNYLIEKAKSILKKESSLIELKRGKVVFIGDTHGDFNATKSIFKKYNPKNYFLVFLGDYIDRGKQSIENINFLLLLKLVYANKVYLLRGNHEAYNVIPLTPYNFLDDLINKFGYRDGKNLHDDYLELFSHLPLMVRTSNSVFAVHAGIIRDAKLEELKNIDKNDREVLRALVWSDLKEGYGRGIPFGKEELKIFLKNVKANVLIRGHDYTTKGSSYNDKCLTIFTSNQYSDFGLIKGRIIAITDLSKKVKNTKDLLVEKI